MTGTSSDVAFADAYVKGVRGFDATDAYDAALKNATVAPAGRPVQLQRRPQGPVPVAVPRLHAVARARRACPGRSRATSTTSASPTWPASSPPPRRTRDEAPLRGGARVLPQPRAGLREHVRPGASASSRAATRRAAGSPRPRTTTRSSGATSTTTRRPTAGASRSTRRRTGRGWRTSTAAAPGWRRSSTRSSPRPETATHLGSYGGTIHEMIEARDVRMGQWGFSNQVSHHIPYMYDYAGQPVQDGREGPRGAAPALRRLGDRAGLRRRRGQRRDVRLVPLQRARLLPAAGRQRELRDRLAAVQEGHGAPRERQGPRGQRAQEQRQERLRARAEAQRRARSIAHSCATPRSRSGGTLEFDMGPQPVASGRPAPPRRRPRSPRATRSPSRCATGPATARRPLRPATRARCSTTTRARPRRRASGCSTASQRAQPVRFYTLTSGTEAGRDPSGWVVKGSNDGSSWTVARRAQRRAVPLALADAAVQAARDRRLRLLPDRVQRAAAPTLGEVELLEPAAARHVGAGDAGDPGRGVGGPDASRFPVKLTNHGAAPASGTLDGHRAGRADRHAGERGASARSPRVQSTTIDADGRRGEAARARHLPDPAGAELEPRPATSATARRSP